LSKKKGGGEYKRNIDLHYVTIYLGTNNIYSFVGVMAFSLGLTLAQAKLTKKQFVMSVLVFSLASPLGMAIGIFLSDLDRSLGVDFANAILQTIAGGTFLYVTFFEVLPHEFNQPKNRMLKVLFVLLGFSIIAGLIFITH
jgi:zinc transporter 1/2/3